MVDAHFLNVVQIEMDLGNDQIVGLFEQVMFMVFFGFLA